MLRFPNPGSSIPTFVAVFAAALQRFSGHVVDNDDFVLAAVEANLATSSGHMGTKAMDRSRRLDRSRDPLFNQLKMYTELFRTLGWLHPIEGRALNYTFTLLGHQVVEAGPYYSRIFSETMLGISHPSRIISNRSEQQIRPFALLLKTMLACDFTLSRDEMIIGPLSVPSDRPADTIPRLCELVSRLRRSRSDVQEGLERISDECGIQPNTLKNYTRWPIGTMRDMGWTIKVRRDYTHERGSFEVHQLTEKGQRLAQLVVDAADVRVEDFESLPADEQEALAIHAHFSMLHRSGFQVESIQTLLEDLTPALSSAKDRLAIPRDALVLFSPFQSISLERIGAIFPTEAPGQQAAPADVRPGSVTGRDSRDHLIIRPILVRQPVPPDDENLRPLKDELTILIAQQSNPQDAAKAFVARHQDDTQAVFYPLVANLIRLLGFNCETSRPGVNYQRWDAYATVDGVTLPIEIKSPTEEEYLSTKAIRQALENKVILLSRGGMPTDRNSSTLIIGFKAPNERGDMAMLIDDIHSAFSISIGVIDLGALAALAIQSVSSGDTVESNQLKQLRGFLHG